MKLHRETKRPDEYTKVSILNKDLFATLSFFALAVMMQCMAFSVSLQEAQCEFVSTAFAVCAWSTVVILHFLTVAALLFVRIVAEDVIVAYKLNKNNSRL